MNEFMKGMDISSYPEMLDKGYQYYDFEGKKINLLDFAKEQGFNYGRLRLWNNPSRIPETQGYCDIEHTKRMAKELVSRELGFMLDFHYSDWWADPGHQEMPQAWKNLTDDELVEAVYSYTREVLEELAANQTYPDIIQIGNEIRCGMMWPAGKVSNWSMLARLINAGIRAVRDTQGTRDSKVMLHLDQGGRYYYFEEWFDHAIENGVEDFDIIGLSYYPFWHGTFSDLKNTMEKLVERYHKPLIVAETAHPHRRSVGSLFGEAQEQIAGFPATPQAQRKVLELIMSITAHIKDNMGLGIFYWEPFVRGSDEEGSWGTCMGMVNDEGRPTEGCKAFAVNVNQIDCDVNAKIYEPRDLVLPQGADIRQYVPETVKVLKWDGRIEAQPVSWNVDDLEDATEGTVAGMLTVSGETVQLQVRIESDDVNYIRNGAFEDALEHWNLHKSETAKTDIRQEVAEEFPFQTEDYFYFASKDNFVLQLSQTVHALEPGKYQLHLEYMGDNTTGVQVAMYAIGEQMEEKKAIFPSDSQWQYCTLEWQVQETTDVEVGIKVDAPAIYGKIKNIALKKYQTARETL
ncbi:MAG: glycosyl hydrolase 53 family protein [Lachnospiraceae bacterium]|nr:glycosyl hydrolase 53 family protein [Lachnospiraceae bacterium]